jgi:hypothetical protein
MQKNNVIINAILISMGLFTVSCGSTENSKPVKSITPHQVVAHQKVSTSDYQRAEQQLKASTAQLVFGTVEQAKWLDKNRLSYRVPTEKGHQFIIVNAKAKSK